MSTKGPNIIPGQQYIRCISTGQVGKTCPSELECVHKLEVPMNNNINMYRSCHHIWVAGWCMETSRLLVSSLSFQKNAKSAAAKKTRPNIISTRMAISTSCKGFNQIPLGSWNFLGHSLTISQPQQQTGGFKSPPHPIPIPVRIFSAHICGLDATPASCISSSRFPCCKNFEMHPSSGWMQDSSAQARKMRAAQENATGPGCLEAPLFNGILESAFDF